MEAVFLKAANLSLTASCLVLAIIAVRLVFRKAPKWLFCLLWSLVALRLLLPFSIESVLSLIPSAEPLPQEILYTEVPQIHSGISAVDNILNPVLSQTMTSAPDDSANPTQIWSFILSRVWVLGALVMLLYFAVSSALLKKKLATATLYQKNIKQSEQVDSPFVVGFFRPTIYLPYHLEENDIAHVIAHEQAHIERRDHWWKPLGFLLLSVYWFNPVLWVAYLLLCRDIEAACDEKVVRELSRDALRAYSTALLHCSVHRRRMTVYSLMFGELGVKDRVKHIMNYQKPTVWIFSIAVAAVIVMAICFLTDPYSERSLNGKLGISMDLAVAEYYSSEKNDENFIATDYHVLGIRKSGKQTTVYAWVLYEEFSFDGTEIHVDSSSHVPTAVTFAATDSDDDSAAYDVLEYWQPRDGSNYADDIRSKFPLLLWRKAFDNSCFRQQEENTRKAAELYFTETADLPAIELPPDRANLSDEVIAYAMDITQADCHYYTEELGYAITKAEITAITLMGTGTTGLDKGLNLYRLEYRFTCANPDEVMVMGGMEMDGDAITEWGSTGQPYFLLYWETEGDATVWYRVCKTNSDTIEVEYGTPEQLAQYGNCYTAAAVELYAKYDLTVLMKIARFTAEDWSRLMQEGTLDDCFLRIQETAVGAQQQQRDSYVMTAFLRSDGAITEFLASVLATQYEADVTAWENASAEFTDGEQELLEIVLKR